MKLRPLLILGAIVVALVITLVVLLNPPKAGEEPEASPSETATFTPPPKLTEYETDAVKSVSVTLLEGGSITFIPDSDGVFQIKDPIETFAANTTNISSLVTSATILNIEKTLVENATAADLAEYHLTPDTATARVKLEMKDGGGTELLVGALTPTGTSYYVTRAGSGKIVTILKYYGDKLTNFPEFYYTLNFFDHTYDSTDPETGVANIVPITNAFDTLELKQKNGDILQLHKRTTEEITNSSGLLLSAYQLLAPIRAEGYDYEIDTHLIAPLDAIAPLKVVDRNPSDLHEYGLDQPVSVTLVGPDEYSVTLLIGDIDKETGGRFVTTEGLDWVLLDTAGTYDFLSLKPIYYRSPTLWLINIKQVTQVDLELGSQPKRVLKIDDGDDGFVSGSLDDVELTEDNTRRMYSRVISLSGAGTDENAAPNAQAEYKFTMFLRDGTKHVLECRRITDLSFEVFIDGNDQQVFVTTTQIKTVLDALEVLDTGGNLERM
jgi:hypothetical protein